MTNVDTASLNAAFGRADAIAFVTGPAGVPHARLTHAGSTASISLHGGHVLDYTPAGQSAVLWTSRAAVFRVGRALRGGIPVCWPWFGPHPSDAALPAHGFARTSIWRVTGSSVDDATRLQLELDETLASPPNWPHSYRLQLDISLADTLQLALKTINTGTAPLPISAALHSYFAVEAITQVTVEGLDATPYLDQLTNTTRMQSGPVHIAGEVDRIYFDTVAPCTIVDAVGERQITIARGGSNSVVVWNPWIDKAQRLSDFDDDEYRSMLCIEAANAASDTIVIAPGADHTLTTTIRSASI